MRFPFSQRVRFTVVLTLILLLLSSIPRPALATSFVNGCSPLSGLGKKVPILLVHGFISNAKNTWYTNQPNPMQNTLNKVPGIYAIFSEDAFDYSYANTEWVDQPVGNRPSSGTALAKAIACYAQTSLENGGPGKVIVIAYSLGGLVTKYAANQIFEGHLVANYIGYIIDIASPSGGANWTDIGVLLLDAGCLLGDLGKFACSFQSITDAVRYNTHSKANLLTPIPKSVPVFTIAGNVQAGRSYYTESLPYYGSDLFVTVESAIKDENKLPNGLGGEYIYQCTTLRPILYVSDADCDHFHLSHSVTVENIVTQQIEKYLDTLHPSCPTTSSTVCLGTHVADVDGDKLPDRVGVTYDSTTPCNESIVFGKTCSVTIYIVQGNGGYIVYPTQLGPYCFETCGFKVGFLGLTPMSGPVNDIILSPSCTMFACPFVAYQVRNDQVQPILFNGGKAGPASNRGDVGFVCSIVNGAYQVEMFSSYAAGQVNTDLDEVYRADATGNMNLVSSKIVDGASVPNSDMGPHCKGLSVPS